MYSAASAGNRHTYALLDVKILSRLFIVEFLFILKPNPVVVCKSCTKTTSEECETAGVASFYFVKCNGHHSIQNSALERVIFWRSAKIRSELGTATLTTNLDVVKVEEQAHE
jgi:hypothetical protein